MMSAQIVQRGSDSNMAMVGIASSQVSPEKKFTVWRSQAYGNPSWVL